jgi:hypothetical protein
VSVVPASTAPEASLQEASRALSRPESAGGPSAAEMRAASEAYQVQASARQQIEQQRQQGGVRSADVLA